MTSAELENLVRLGQLKREPSMVSEIRGLLRSGEARLADAANRALSLESRFDLAYNAAHAMALAALRPEYEGALDVDEGLVADLIKASEAVRVALRAAGLPPEV